MMTSHQSTSDQERTRRSVEARRLHDRVSEDHEKCRRVEVELNMVGLLDTDKVEKIHISGTRTSCIHLRTLIKSGKGEEGYKKEAPKVEDENSKGRVRDRAGVGQEVIKRVLEGRTALLERIGSVKAYSRGIRTALMESLQIEDNVSKQEISRKTEMQQEGQL